MTAWDATWTAVWKFQRDRGLSPTGIADAQVLLQLGLVAVPGAPGAGVGGTLRYGSSGIQVYVLQNALKSRGFYSQAPNGVYDDVTWRAVWLYQSSAGCIPTASPAQPPCRAGLSAGAAPLRRRHPQAPASSTAARAPRYALQNALKSRGFYSQTPNGVYDDAT